MGDDILDCAGVVGVHGGWLAAGVSWMAETEVVWVESWDVNTLERLGQERSGEGEQDVEKRRQVMLCSV